MCFNIMYSVGQSIFFKKDNRNNGRSLNSELVTIKKSKNKLRQTTHCHTLMGYSTFLQE